MNSNKTPTTIEPELLTVDDICNILQIKKSSFYSMKQNGSFGPIHLKFCRHLRYLKSDFDLWLKLGTPRRERFQNILRGQKCA